MKRIVVAAALVVIGLGSSVGAHRDDRDNRDRNVIRAHATLIDATGNSIGIVKFEQAPADANLPTPGVEVLAFATGLPPGQHGMHIHENGVCDPASVPLFGTAGSHFDPGPAGSNVPVDANHPYHMGDLPNLEVNRHGFGSLRAVTSRVTLSVSPANQLTVFDTNGSAVIVHMNPDQGATGVTGASGGPRIACGVIVLD
jgi:Cu/Zn superoxide dismutase